MYLSDFGGYGKVGKSTEYAATYSLIYGLTAWLKVGANELGLNSEQIKPLQIKEILKAAKMANDSSAVEYLIMQNQE